MYPWTMSRDINFFLCYIKQSLLHLFKKPRYKQTVNSQKNKGQNNINNHGKKSFYFKPSTSVNLKCKKCGQNLEQAVFFFSRTKLFALELKTIKMPFGTN